MAEENKESQVLRVICLAAGIFTGLFLMNFVFKMSGALPGAIAGGGGALLGMFVYAVILRLKG
ncbi:MAG TPA: hypothetical protein VGC76_07900 [Pyrinomonadaceae bacterium]|jgi:hypothetical protein